MEVSLFESEASPKQKKTLKFPLFSKIKVLSISQSLHNFADKFSFFIFLNSFLRHLICFSQIIATRANTEIIQMISYRPIPNRVTTLWIFSKNIFIPIRWTILYFLTHVSSDPILSLNMVIRMSAWRTRYETHGEPVVKCRVPHVLIEI